MVARACVEGCHLLSVLGTRTVKCLALLSAACGASEQDKPGNFGN